MCFFHCLFFAFIELYLLKYFVLYEYTICLLRLKMFAEWNFS